MQHIDGCRDYNGSINCRIQSTVADFKLEAGWLFLEWNRHVQLTRHDPVSLITREWMMSAAQSTKMYYSILYKRRGN